MTSDSKRIEDSIMQRIVQRGLLTGEEAERLQRSLDDQARDAETLAKARTKPQRKRFYHLLGLCAIFLLLGMFAGYLLVEQSVTEQTASAANQLTAPKADIGARPVDLSVLNEERRQTMAKTTRLSGAVLFLIIAAIVAVLLMVLYNSLIDSRERVNAGWAQVENVYQRRLDLVPVLIDGVETYMEHERETLQALTEARANALGVNQMLGGQAPQSADQMRTLEASQGKLQSALARLFAVVENYPDLKASQNFLTLQDQIEGTENRIAMERRHYNEFARAYNAKVLKFPTNLVAGMMDFTGKPYFEAEEKALQGLEDPFNREGRD
jgi:LemA protein